MRTALPTSEDDGLNPYIALSDLVITLILIVVFFVALGQLGLVNLRYRRAMQEFARAVATELPESRRPRWERGRNDPPGVQRWVFSGRKLFMAEGKGGGDGLVLTEEGRRSLALFAGVLARYRASWRRIRVEGHTQPPFDNTPDDWELSARRAAIVVREIEIAGHIPAWYCAVSGRAGQNPLHKLLLYAPTQRVPGGDQTARRLEDDLRRQGVTFSVKSPTEATPGQTPDMPILVERNDTGSDRRISPADPAAIAEAVARFRENERVEVLVEYTRGNAAPSTPATL